MKHTSPHKDRNKARKDSRRLDLETWILLGILLPLTIIILKAL